MRGLTSDPKTERSRGGVDREWPVLRTPTVARCRGVGPRRRFYPPIHGPRDDSSMTENGWSAKGMASQGVRRMNLHGVKTIPFAFIGLLTLGALGAPTPLSPVVELDVLYGKDTGSQTLDLYLPAKKGFPTIVYI